MSGGTFEYKNFVIRDISEHLKLCVGDPCKDRYQDCPRSAKVLELYGYLSRILDATDTLVYAVDYYEAGDINEEELFRRCKEALL